jgi:hypothetical protein
MSDEFDGRGAAEKASIEGDLNRCRARAPQIASEPRNEQLKHFADNCRWQTFAPPLRTLPMSSDRKPDGGREPIDPVVKILEVRHRQR